MGAEHFTSIFAQLKTILAPYADALHLVKNSAQEYYLDTHTIMKNRKPLFFAAVKINRRYVSYHLMPVYVFPDLLTPISAPLKKRMQGKSCFNFASPSETLFAELANLTQRGFSRYQTAGYV